MGRNNLFMSGADKSYPASATSRIQHPSGGDATCEGAMPHECHQEAWSAACECHQMRGSQNHKHCGSASPPPAEALSYPGPETYSMAGAHSDMDFQHYESKWVGSLFASRHLQNYLLSA